MTEQEIIEHFLDAMREQGIETNERIIPDGNLHRFNIIGHKPGRKNGAYLLHTDGIMPAGYFENHATQLKQTWKLGQFLKPFNPVDRAEQLEKQKQRDMEQAQKYERTANRARELWNLATPITDASHPYLIRKHVRGHRARILATYQQRILDSAGRWVTFSADQVLVLPIQDIQKKLWNLQLIFTEQQPLLGRDKSFLPGGKVKGLFVKIGNHTPDMIICEGFATGATLHQSTGHQVICALSAGNLLPVAEQFRHRYPNHRLIVAADNDAKTPKNPGLTAAKIAAETVTGCLAVPPIPGDFNDYALSQMENEHE